ncbi:hypothetical protein LCGC14_0009040 [marine sediment metagenome]|uniref:FAD/NAD(P)-binding domain-containing protein n=2 Tax=root TaxID=1 RepID=A0A0F9YKV5_9ZZZZ
MHRPKPRLLIVGFGMAAGRLLQEISLQAPGLFDTSVIGEESQSAYNRILLSPLLAGESDASLLPLHSASWYRSQDIAVHTGDPVIALDTDSRVASTASGACHKWDMLVLATGSRAARLPLPGVDLSGIVSLRTLDDAEAVMARIGSTGQADDDRVRRAVVVGGGVLGLEAACALQNRGVTTTVVHNAGWPMNRQLDSEAGEYLAATLAARNIRFISDAQCKRFVATADGQSVAGLQLGDGELLACELVIMAVGIAPEVSLARQTNLSVARAINVDAWLRSSQHGVFALGECCEIDGEQFGLVAPIYQQAQVLAKVLQRCAESGPDASLTDVEPYTRQSLPTRLKVSGVHVFSAGTLDETGHQTSPSQRSLAWRDKNAGEYRRLWWQGDCLQAAVMFGDVDDSGIYESLIENRAPVQASPQALLNPAGLVPQ